MIHMIVEQNPLPQDFTARSIQKLQTLVRKYMSAAEVDLVLRALQLAEEISRGEQAIPPLKHALAVATILAEMHIDAVGVASGLVFEAVDAGLLSLDLVETSLGLVVSRIVDSMSRLNILERKKQSMEQVTSAAQTEVDNSREQKKRRNRDAMRKQQAETVRKMFLGMAEDPRVVILKLAYRLHAMRMVRITPTVLVDFQERIKLAEETRDIYAPLAGRLGMSRVESELEDLAFAVLQPDIYAWLLDQVEAESIHWRSYVNRVCGILRDEMGTLGVKAEVSGRVKHVFSFYKKLRRHSGDVETLEELRENADFSQIHDLIAFRILVPTTSDCYVALGHVHSLWRPKEGRIKDFIANPKPNGYSALHTTVFCMDNQLVEIQIRTFEMHEMAEYGVAMHWHYKDVGDTASSSAKELLAWLRQLADWQRELRSSTSSSSENEIVEAVREGIFDEQIFVFTPRGEVRDLPVGSTPLDFAYRIHSEVGDKCAGARVTSDTRAGDTDRLVTRMVPLDYELKSGDIVDIITNRTAHPTRDWLNFVRTAAAKSKIRRYLKLHERDINIQIGRERLERELKLVSSRGFEPLASEEMQEWLANEFHQDSFEDLLSAIGIDKIRPHAVSVKLAERLPQFRESRDSKDGKEGLKDTEELPALAPLAKPASSSAKLEVAGVSGLLTRLANCCCPLPGDEIVGFISRGNGVIIHRADCRNLTRYREHERERLINVGWTTMTKQTYRASVIIHAQDRSGLIRDIATIVSEVGVNMASVSTTVIKDRATVSAQMEVESLEQMERLFYKIERVNGVTLVERDLGQKKK